MRQDVRQDYHGNTDGNRALTTVALALVSHTTSVSSDETLLHIEDLSTDTGFTSEKVSKAY